MDLGEYSELLAPRRLWARDEILCRNCPVPYEPGVYAWYFRAVPPGVPTNACHRWEGLPLLYVGISPTRSPQNGKPPSRQRLRNRVRYHLRGNAEGSTLRLTLGCLLRGELGIRLRRVGSGTRRTFAGGESLLSSWMGESARVAWMAHPEPWEVEEHLINALSLPLNLQHNEHHPFRDTLSRIRKACRQQADAAPIWQRE